MSRLLAQLPNIVRRREVSNMHGNRLPHHHTKYEVPFEERLPSFSVITIWDRADGLTFAIKQLKARKKAYSIEHKQGKIRLWSESSVGNW